MLIEEFKMSQNGRPKLDYQLNLGLNEGFARINHPTRKPISSRFNEKIAILNPEFLNWTSVTESGIQTWLAVPRWMRIDMYRKGGHSNFEEEEIKF